MPRGRQARQTVIVHRQEVLALRLLDRALERVEDQPEAPLDVQLDVFERVGKWVSIKNRLEDTEETDIDRFKQRIAGEAPVTQGRKRRNGRDPADTGAERLAQIKSRLPHRGSSGIDGNRGDPGVEVPVTVGGSRGLSIGVPGDSES